jgi:Ca2+/Na+ antiporter
VLTSAAGCSALLLLIVAGLLLLAISAKHQKQKTSTHLFPQWPQYSTGSTVQPYAAPAAAVLFQQSTTPQTRAHLFLLLLAVAALLLLAVAALLLLAVAALLLLVVAGLLLIGCFSKARHRTKTPPPCCCWLFQPCCCCCWLSQQST